MTAPAGPGRPTRPPGPPLEIGPRAEDDLHQLFALARGVYAGMPGWSDGRVLGALRRDVVFVAREYGAPAGYVALRPLPAATIVVEQLFVAPGHEQRGVGRRLLAWAEGYAIAEHARRLQAVVEEDNLPARGLYRRAGFVPCDAELLELVLPQD